MSSFFAIILKLYTIVYKRLDFVAKNITAQNKKIIFLFSRTITAMRVAMLARVCYNIDIKELI